MECKYDDSGKKSMSMILVFIYQEDEQNDKDSIEHETNFKNNINANRIISNLVGINSIECMSAGCLLIIVEAALR